MHSHEAVHGMNMWQSVQLIKYAQKTQSQTPDYRR